MDDFDFIDKKIIHFMEKKLQKLPEVAPTNYTLVVMLPQWQDLRALTQRQNSRAP